jgi:hypothetical protein
MRWGGYVARMEKLQIILSLENMNGTDHLGDPGGKIILKWIVKK